MIDDCAEMRRLLAASNSIVYESGYTKPLANASLSDKKEISMLFLHQTIFRSMAEWRQLRRGLGGCEEMAKRSETLFGFFTNALIAGLDI